jgi:hypothetical protein
MELGKVLNKFVGSLRHAPNEARDLSLKVFLLCTVLGKIKPALGKLHDQHPDLNKVIEACESDAKAIYKQFTNFKVTKG